MNRQSTKQRLDRLEAQQSGTAHTAAIDAWKASYTAVKQGRISYAEHRAWVLSNHEPGKRDMFKKLWADACEIA